MYTYIVLPIVLFLILFIRLVMGKQSVFYRHTKYFLVVTMFYVLGVVSMSLEFYFSSVIGAFIIVISSQVLCSIVGIESEFLGNVSKPDNAVKSKH